MLKSQEQVPKVTRIPHRNTYPMGGQSSGSGNFSTPNADFTVPNPDIAMCPDREQWRFNGESPQPMADEMAFDPSLGMTMDPNFAWELIGLGLDEPLPPQETIDELYVLCVAMCGLTLIQDRHQIYFEKIHPSLPMIHKYRYLAAMNL